MDQIMKYPLQPFHKQKTKNKIKQDKTKQILKL